MKIKYYLINKENGENLMGNPPFKIRNKSGNNLSYLREKNSLCAKTFKTMLQFATLWSSNAQTWFFYASTSWAYACEPFHLLPIC